MAIASPYYSFIQFSPEHLNCYDETNQARLPVHGTFGAKFQFKIEDELLPDNTILKAAVCSADCELLFNPDYEVIPLCTRYKFMATGGIELTSDLFPLAVGNYAPVGDEPQIPEGTYDLPSFLAIVSDLYETSISSLDFIDCCEIPEISRIVVFFNATGFAKNLSLNRYYAHGYVDFPEESMVGKVAPEQCFRYCILDSNDEVLGCSNLFYNELDDCYLSQVTYYNEENSYGFKYSSYNIGEDTFFTENQLWLPIYLRRPTNPITETVFRRSDGSKQRLSTIIEKEWEGKAGYLSNEQRDRLTAALKSDVLIVNNAYSGVNYRMIQEGDITPDYPEDINTPLAPSTFKITDYSQAGVNNNCGFNCGVEFIDDCEGGGGIIVPCPDKYSVEFIIPNGKIGIDGTTYQDDNLIGLTASGIEVYREGVLQYTVGDTTYSIDPTTGTVVFTPAVTKDERFAIWEV